MDEAAWEGNRDDRPHAGITPLQRSSPHVAAWHDDL
jgi:hypothetical protein